VDLEKSIKTNVKQKRALHFATPKERIILDCWLLNSSICGIATVILIYMDVLNVPIGIFVVRQVPVRRSGVHYNMLVAAFLLDSFVTTGNQNAAFDLLGINFSRVVIQTHIIFLLAVI